jgi:hypothetical protein
MAVSSGFRGLRRVAFCRGAPGVAYESVALPSSYPAFVHILRQFRRILSGPPRGSSSIRFHSARVVGSGGLAAKRSGPRCRYRIVIAIR